MKKEKINQTQPKKELSKPESKSILNDIKSETPDQIKEDLDVYIDEFDNEDPKQKRLTKPSTKPWKNQTNKQQENYSDFSKFHENEVDNTDMNVILKEENKFSDFELSKGKTKNGKDVVKTTYLPNSPYANNVDTYYIAN